MEFGYAKYEPMHNHEELDHRYLLVEYYLWHTQGSSTRCLQESLQQPLHGYAYDSPRFKKHLRQPYPEPEDERNGLINIAIFREVIEQELTKLLDFQPFLKIL
jgi:hypothetical protein